MPVLDLSKSKQSEIRFMLLRQKTIQKVIRKSENEEMPTPAKKTSNPFSCTKPFALLFSLHHFELPQNR